jgi:hypothetical protein
MLVSICLQNLELQAQKAGRQLVVWAFTARCLALPWVWDDQSGWCKLCCGMLISSNVVLTTM